VDELFREEAHDEDLGVDIPDEPLSVRVVLAL
jgi:hypothetical protein